MHDGPALGKQSRVAGRLRPLEALGGLEWLRAGEKGVWSHHAGLWKGHTR